MGAKLPQGCCKLSGKRVEWPVVIDICSVASPNRPCKARVAGWGLETVASPKKKGLDDAKMGAGNCLARKVHQRIEAKGHTMLEYASLSPKLRRVESAAEACRSPALSMSENAFAIL